MAKNETKFECSDLALCVLEALSQAGLVEVTRRIPEVEPEDDDDLDDESESWRDRLENDQTEVVDELLALLEKNRHELPKVKEVSGVLLHVAEGMYEPEMWSLAGIEACTGLESLEIWTSERKLDLAPLTRLPRLATVDLTCAGGLETLDALLEIPSLKTVIASGLDRRLAEALQERGVTVTKAG